MKLSALLLPALSLLLPACAQNQIVSGAAWTDTSGNAIQAHGAGILKVRTLCVRIHVGTLTMSIGRQHLLLVRRR